MGCLLCWQRRFGSTRRSVNSTGRRRREEPRMENRNRQVLLKRRPTGAPTTADFDIADGPVPDPREGEVLVRGIYLSLDPYMRGRISAARSYAKPVDVGAVMEGRVVGQVARSRDPGFREGDYAFGGYGWQLYSAVPGKGLLKLDPTEAPLSTALGVLGMPGLTAHVGLSEIGRPQRGETVVVSAASGAVGAVVGQLAKRAGARIVGIAGGADKCRYVEGELGFDNCIDHRSADLGAALDRACPNLTSAVRKRLKIQGFIVSDQWQRFGEYRAMAAPLVRSGELKYREDIVEGLDRAPEAFIGLLNGRNFGKLLIKLGDDPTAKA